MDRRFLEILLASTNPAKQGKLRWLLEGLPLNLILTTPDWVATRPRVQEDGPSHRDNAIRKAIAWSQTTKGLAIASDGGLLIASLGEKWDSLRTHRFAGEDANDRTCLERLLALMTPLQGKDREVSWLEAVAIAENGALVGSCEAESGDGVLATSFASQRTISGFWAAAIWYFPAVGKTYAEMDIHELAQVRDHWSQLKPQVQQLVLSHCQPS